MTQRRLSTVYDYSNLRLHPDGTRVYQTADNVRPHLVRITSQGPRGTWIARDAGGSGRVSRYRKPIKDVSEEPGEEVDLNGDVEGDGLEGKSGGPSGGQEDEKNEDGEEKEDSEDEIEGGKRKLRQHDKRKLKRQKFEANFEYLQEPQPLPIHESQNSTEADNLEMAEKELPEPSTDLLKTIHRFAAEFYTERGQLLNISRQYRNERKLRNLQKLARQGKHGRRGKGRQSDASSGSNTPDNSEEEEELSEELPEEEDEQDDSPKGDEDEDGQDEDSDKEYEENPEEGTSDEDEDAKRQGNKKSQNVKGKGRAKPKRKGRRRSEKLYTDMYKMFDGSAIMAIGMLVQETIAHMLDTEIPAGWQEEVDKMYGSHDEDEDEKLGVENEGQDRQAEQDEEEDKDEEEEEEEEGEEDEEDEEEEQEEDGGGGDDHDEEDEDEDDDFARANESRSPPLTKSGGVSSDSDADMKAGSDIETHDLDDDESHDSSASD